jgi:U3 small nucleolar RNA-associated protein 5
MGHARLSIPLYQNSGALQSTLTCSVENQDQVAKLVFCSSTHLCALFTSFKVVVWNVERGVLVHTLEGDCVDITACGENSRDSLYCLVPKKGKLYVHEHSLDTGRVVRKIKCGKGAGGTLAVSDSFIAVRQEGVVRIMSQSNGSKVGKCKLFESGQMAMSGSVIAAVTSTGVTLLSCETQEQVGTVFLEAAPVHSLTMTKDLLLVNSAFGCELYDYTALPTTSKEPLKPTTTITLPESDVRVHLHGRNVIAVLRNEQGQVHIQKVDIRDQTNVVVQNPTGQDEETRTTTKRSLPFSTTTATTLGPGQAGAEAMQVDDRVIKKAKTTTNEQDISIQERLQQLAREFQEEEDDDDDDEVSPKPFKATTESLSNLLQQCLQSGDDTMLELSLTCRDRQIIQRSLQQLEPNLVSTLLTKLTSRLASKPNRAGDLALWIQLILTSGKIRNVQQLRPLRNLLHERVESFPHLLKLEGRLSVLQASSSLK